jgi:hypothetical protein
MADKRILYTLPVPSTDLDGEARLCGETLQFQYQRDGTRVRGGIRFEHVAATRTRVERNSTVWHIEGAYDTLVEIVPSAWAEEIRAATEARWRDHWALHHYLIYVDSAGSFEVLADSFRVLPEEVGSWTQD